MNATKKSIKGCQTFEDVLNVQYGLEGTPERDQFECDTEAFILAERLKEERLKAGLTQEQLAEKIGAKKSAFALLFPSCRFIPILTLQTTSDKSLMSGLGELTDAKMKSFVRTKLRKEAIQLLQFFKEFPTLA